MTTRTFPEGFRWGTATAAHQIEGGNWNNDWWEWEHTPGSGCVEPSGDALRHWHRWPEDVALLAELGFDNYRFSIEWSRIEPEDGEFSTAALDHYRRMCDGAASRTASTPVVTFHHFTTPRWVATQGRVDRAGDRRSVRALLRARPRRTSATSIDAGVHDQRAEHRGDDRLSRRALPAREAKAIGQLRRKANEVFVDAHRKAVDAIRSGDARRAGRAHARDAADVPGRRRRRVASRDRRAARILDGLEDVYLEAAEGDDFIGVQTYPRTASGPSGDARPRGGRRRPRSWATSSGPRRSRRRSAGRGR